MESEPPRGGAAQEPQRRVGGCVSWILLATASTVRIMPAHRQATGGRLAGGRPSAGRLRVGSSVGRAAAF